MPGVSIRQLVKRFGDVVERAVALETGDRITAATLPDPGSLALWAPATAVGAPDGEPLEPSEWVARAVLGIERWLARGPATVDLEALVGQFETGVLDAALQQARGHKTEAARLLGLSFRSMRYKLGKLQRDDSDS